MNFTQQQDNQFVALSAHSGAKHLVTPCMGKPSLAQQVAQDLSTDTVGNKPDDLIDDPSAEQSFDRQRPQVPYQHISVSNT